MTILVTGSEGLIGCHLSQKLASIGYPIRRFDIRRSAAEDIRNRQALAGAMVGVEGIVHLAAVSRVVWGERDPAKCVATNVTALQNLIDIAARSTSRPWVLFASSREVYGNSGRLPISEDAPLKPINVYAQTKQEGEKRVLAARDSGLVTNVARLSSVYGWSGDHQDRVAPAFALAAVRGGRIQVEGCANTFDFTFVDDVTDGLLRFVIATARGERLPAIHLASGAGTSLATLAQIAADNARKPVEVVEERPRPNGVGRFIGDPARAAALLGWSATVPVQEGMKRLINQYAARDKP